MLCKGKNDDEIEAKAERQTTERFPYQNLTAV